MTLYGQDSGPLVGSYLGALAHPLGSKHLNVDNRDHYYYEVGSARKFTAKELAVVGVDGLKNNIIQTMFPGDKEAPVIRSACWNGPAPTVAEAKIYDWNVTSSIEVETQSRPNGHWQPLMVHGVPVDDKGVDIIVQLSEWNDMQSRWCAFFLPPSDLKEAGLLRFKVTGQDHVVHLLPMQVQK